MKHMKSFKLHVLYALQCLIWFHIQCNIDMLIRSAYLVQNEFFTHLCSMKMIIKTMAGFEPLLAEELRVLGAENIEILRRAVSCEGDKKLMYEMNLWLRTGIRVLIPFAQFTAHNEMAFYEETKKIDWSEFLSNDKTFAINASSQSAKFNHTHYLTLKAKDAIVDQFRERTDERPSIDIENPHFRLHVHVDSLNNFTLSKDSSGDGLHRRGYRTSGGMAPLNEILAAGMIQLSGWDKQTPFIDFMCGSGTILIEAAQLALNIPPGLNRYFGFHFWPDYDPEMWSDILADARTKIKSECPPIIGNDLNFKAVKIATQNAEAAKVDHVITFKRGNLTNFEPPAGPGILITNPPYDMRLESDDIGELYKMIGDKFKASFAGYQAWILSANMAALKQVGLRTSRKIPLFNGQLECKFQRYDMYDGSKKRKKNEVE